MFFFYYKQIASKLGLGDGSIIISSMQLKNSYEGKQFDIFVIVYV